MRLGSQIGRQSCRGAERLDGREGARRQRFTVLALEALEPRELLAAPPPSLKINPDVAGEVAAMGHSVIPTVVTSRPAIFADPAYGRIPLPPGPAAPNLQLAASANLLARPLFADTLGLSTTFGAGDEDNQQSVAGAANPPKTLLPQKPLTPPTPGQIPTPPPSPNAPPVPPPNPSILLANQAGSNQPANSPAAASGSQEARAANDQAILALFPEASETLAVPVAPPASSKPEATGVLANRPGTVR
jgi:hypothetical protein